MQNTQTALAPALPAKNAGPTSNYRLNRQHYLDQGWFDQEMSAVFGRSWIYAGLTSDFKEPGDFRAVQAGPHPLFVIRDGQGALHAHYNICRHRGVRLVQGNGNARGGVTCFYHRWHYEVDGRLRGLPNADKFPCIDKASLGLKRASVATWNGLVFVNAQEAPAQTLDQWLGEFPLRHGPWVPNELVEVQTLEHELKANWKLFVENHVDGYHLFHLHAKSIEGLDHSQQQWFASAERHWSLTEPVTTPGQLPEQMRSPSYRLPRIPGVGTDRDGSTVHYLFPNLAIAAGATYYILVELQPRGPALTTIRTRLLGMQPDMASLVMSSGFLLRLAMRKLTGQPDYVVRPSPQNADGDFLGEDVYAVEAIQFAMSSDRHQVGPLAQDYESAIPYFQTALLNAME
jgi:choline monooxygenase